MGSADPVLPHGSPSEPPGTPGSGDGVRLETLQDDGPAREIQPWNAALRGAIGRSAAAFSRDATTPTGYIRSLPARSAGRVRRPLVPDGDRFQRPREGDAGGLARRYEGVDASDDHTAFSPFHIAR